MSIFICTYMFTHPWVNLISYMRTVKKYLQIVSNTYLKDEIEGPVCMVSGVSS